MYTYHHMYLLTDNAHALAKETAGELRNLTSLNKDSKSDSLMVNGRLETNTVFLSKDVGN